MVTAKYGNIVIHDWDQLVSLADFDDDFMLLEVPSPRLTDAGAST